MLTPERVVEQLTQVIDPELRINIVDLGLIYDVEVLDEGKVKVLMTLTSPACGMGPIIMTMARRSIKRLEGVTDAQIEFTFDPLWTEDKMSDRAKKARRMGIM